MKVKSLVCAHLHRDLHHARTDGVDGSASGRTCHSARRWGTTVPAASLGAVRALLPERWHRRCSEPPALRSSRAHVDGEGHAPSMRTGSR